MKNKNLFNKRLVFKKSASETRASQETQNAIEKDEKTPDKKNGESAKKMVQDSFGQVAESEIAELDKNFPIA